MGNRREPAVPPTLSLSGGLIRKAIFWLFVLALPLVFSANGAAQRGGARHEHELFQVSTLDALSLGLYQGALSFGELKKHGNFGLGTFEGLDGEMVALDGRFYQVHADGRIDRVRNDATTPFAAVTVFDGNDTDLRLTISEPASLSQLTALIDGIVPSKNFFYAVKVHGAFSDLTARSVPRQSVPYPPLATAVSQQALFVHSGIAGTLVGFRCPDFAKGINQTGYHFHFISDDEKTGGHALTFTLSQGMVEIEIIRANSLVLPETPAFRTAPLPLP